MPKLNDIWIKQKTDDGAEFEYRATASVTTGGQFSVHLDDRLRQVAIKHPRIRDFTLGDRGQKCTVNGPNLDHILAFIHDCAREYLAVETTESRVLVYGYQFKTAFWLTGQEIYPCGDEHLEGKWFQSKHLERFQDSGFYMVGVGAAVFDKTVYNRATGQTATYELVRDSDDPSIRRLNSFTGLNIDPLHKIYHQMPYTPEAAQFFYRVMISLCRLARGAAIKAYFQKCNEM